MGLRIRNERRALDELIVVRGGPLDQAFLERAASQTFTRFGEYGVSVFAAPDETALDALAAGPLGGYAQLTLLTVGAIRGAGLELRPTFRRPHYTVIFVDVAEGAERLRSCDNVIRDNAFHAPT